MKSINKHAKFTGKHIIDVITLLVLTGAFVMCMIYGFLRVDIFGEGALSPTILAAVSLIVPALLFASGPLSSLLGRIRFSLLTKTFTYIFASQIAAFIGMLTLMLSLILGVFENGAATPSLPVFYIIFALIFVVGYGESALASEPMIALRQAEADELILNAEADEGDSSDYDEGENSDDESDIGDTDGE